MAKSWDWVGIMFFLSQLIPTGDIPNFCLPTFLSTQVSNQFFPRNCSIQFFHTIVPPNFQQIFKSKFSTKSFHLIFSHIFFNLIYQKNDPPNFLPNIWTSYSTLFPYIFNTLSKLLPSFFALCWILYPIRCILSNTHSNQKGKLYFFKF